MRLLLITLFILVSGCNEANQANSNSSGVNSLTNEEQKAQQEFQLRSVQTEDELDDFDRIIDEIDATDNSRPEIVPDPRPVPYSWFKRLFHRLQKLDEVLESVYKAYYNLPQRLQEIIKPWLTRHLKHTHSRLEKLKERLKYFYRYSYDWGVCILTDELSDSSANIVDAESFSQNSAASSLAGVRVDSDGEVYCDDFEGFPRVLICAPTSADTCRDVCTDNFHLLKRLILLIEDIQSKIERFVDSIN